jgi:uncharacterized protein Yka (UPF0111/DUF47 family)
MTLASGEHTGPCLGSALEPMHTDYPADPTQLATPALLKREAVEELGEPALLLPSLVRQALRANDRAKYFLSLLQTSRSHADAPSQPWTSLREERLAAEVSDPSLDSVVERSRRDGDDLYLIPDAARIHQLLISAIEQMLMPLGTGIRGPDDTNMTSRLEALLSDSPPPSGDGIRGAYIDVITTVRPARGDSLHLLIMDAHRKLNRLQSDVTGESVEGAAVYGLGAGDKDLVCAFMQGLHSTSPLKFDHPGLSTSATRVGDRLLIQNDLGTTTAHVVVFAVDASTVTITYSDVHLRRLQFLASLFDSYPMRWSHVEHGDATASLGEHHLTKGTYHAPGHADLEDFLRFAGSRLVFVLDWNRARKVLRTFLPGDDVVAMLRWAADNNIGHMAFLVLGGDRLIYDAIELAAKVPAQYGEPLIDVLGRDALLEITQFALRTASEGMLAEKSTLLIRDELRVEVLRHVQASNRRLLDASAEHATLVVQCAQVLHSALVRLATGGGHSYLERAAQRAAAWEHQADEILTAQRQAGRRVEGGRSITALTAFADDALDAFEEAVYLLTLLPAEAAGAIRYILDPVASVATLSAREYFKSVQLAKQLLNGSVPDDLEDFLVAVDRVATLEHDADSADRLARATLVTQAPDFRTLYVADQVSRGAEEATDSLLRSALGLRDHVLNVLSIR